MSEQHWPREMPKRRHNENEAEDLKGYIDGRIAVLEVHIDEQHKSTSMHCKRIEELMARYAAGFPGDDPEGHRRFHESLIERNKVFSELGRKLLFELAKWGLLGFVAWLCISGWHEIINAIRSAK